MTNLYQGDMAAIFDAMYQSFIDFDQEYEFYNELLQQSHCESLLEIGSGSGNLAKRFLDHQKNYLGLESSQYKLDIAMEKNKSSCFILADMRNFMLEQPVQAVIISGRSTSYLINNEDVIDSFECIHKNLSPQGILIFDFIDASRFIPFIKKEPHIVHKGHFDGVDYIRESHWATTPMDNFILDWNALYYRVEQGEKLLLLDDFTSVRVFTLNEIELLLYLNNFEILQVIDRKSYAFDTYVIKARKIL